jgi:predicted small lipoprotein YifL
MTRLPRQCERSNCHRERSYRHRERSEAIPVRLSPPGRPGLLRFARNDTWLVLAALLAVLALGACGKKGPPTPPGPPDKVTWPRAYPTH